MRALAAILMLTVSMNVCWAQSSSLLVAQDSEPPRPLVAGRMVSALSPAVAQNHFAAVRLPEPREFQIHDLVTIVIREATEADSSSKLDTQRESTIEGEIKDIPDLQLSKLLQFQLEQSNLNPNPKVSINTNNEFKGEGDYGRRDTFSGRITAQIIDIKPNGTLVLEARKYIRSDKETLSMTLTGTCRQEDVSLDNTVLSTQMYDLRLNKEHSGELKRATKKGLITKIFELVFNF